MSELFWLACIQISDPVLEHPEEPQGMGPDMLRGLLLSEQSNVQNTEGITTPRNNTRVSMDLFRSREDAEAWIQACCDAIGMGGSRDDFERSDRATIWDDPNASVQAIRPK